METRSTSWYVFQDSANVGMPSLSRVGRILILFKLSEREISGHLEMGTVQKVSHTLYILANTIFSIWVLSNICLKVESQSSRQSRPSVAGVSIVLC